MTICASDLNTQFPSPRFSIGMRPRFTIPLINIVFCSSCYGLCISASFSGFLCSETAFCGFIFTFRFLTCYPFIKLALVYFSLTISYFKQRILGCPRVITRYKKKIAFITMPLLLRTF
jgi:hypothetical protein